MVRRFLTHLVTFLKNLGRKRQDISWKEINGIMRDDRSRK